jgi:hypothetical protein
VLASLVAVILFFVGTFFVVREIGRRDAVRNARELAQLAGQGIVEPTITRGVLDGRRAPLDRLDRVVQERVLSDRVLRIKIWTRDGRIVYSDEPRLIGSRFVLARGARRRHQPRRVGRRDCERPASSALWGRSA